LGERLLLSLEREEELEELEEREEGVKESETDCLLYRYPIVNPSCLFSFTARSCRPGS
jgi:hypothetical protein